MANHAITHTFGGVLYIPTAWVSLCSFTCLAVVGLESRTSRSQRPRFSFVVMEHQFNQSDSGCLADLLQERMNHDELKYKVFDWLRFPLIVFVVYIHSFGKPIDFYAIDFSNPMPMDYYNLLRISISHVLTHIAVPMFFLSHVSCFSISFKNGTELSISTS